MTRYLISDPTAFPALEATLVRVEGDDDLDLVRACRRAGFFRDFAYDSLDLIDVVYVGERTVEFMHDGQVIAVGVEEKGA